MNTALMFSTGKDDWATPLELFAALDDEFTFKVDLAASAANAKCLLFYCEENSALAGDADWSQLIGPGWCNPPYSRGRQSMFVEKAARQRLKGFTTVMLLPARTDTRAFHAHIWDAEAHQSREGVEVRFLKGRLKFVGAKDAAPFPSMVVVFRGVSA